MQHCKPCFCSSKQNDAGMNDWVEFGFLLGRRDCQFFWGCCELTEYKCPVFYAQTSLIQGFGEGCVCHMASAHYEKKESLEKRIMLGEVEGSGDPWKAFSRFASLQLGPEDPPTRISRVGSWDIQTRILGGLGLNPHFYHGSSLGNLGPITE